MTTRTATLYKPQVRLRTADQYGDWPLDVLLPSGWHTSAGLICPHSYHQTGYYKLVCGGEAL